MSKPADVPQRVWDEACGVWEDLASIHRSRDNETSLIAAAILAAEQRERERIEALLAHGAPHSPRRYIYDITPDRRIWACDQLDQSIRNRGTEND